MVETLFFNDFFFKKKTSKPDSVGYILLVKRTKRIPTRGAQPGDARFFVGLFVLLSFVL